MSQVCKFFQSNSCRYGNKCRYKHVYEEPQYYDQRKQQSGSSILKGNSQFTKTNVYPQQKEEIDLRRFTEDVALAVKAIDEQGIWPLSCFGCIQSYGNLEGFEDLSPEELRWRAYEATASGKFPQYVEETQVLLKKAAAVRSVFIGKGPTASSILHNYYLQGSKKETNNPSASGSSIFANSSVFPSNVATFTPPPSFGMSQPQNFQVQQMPQPSSVFNTNIFAQALHDQNEMQTSPFGDTVQRGIFGQPVVSMSEPMSVFGLNQTNVANDLFKQNIFANALQSTQSTSTSGFYQPQPTLTSLPIGQPTFLPQSSSKQLSVNLLYSQIENLTPDELDQYKATTFMYGKTPLKPPPKELC